MYRFLFFYANMIVNKNEVLNKVKLKLKLKLNWSLSDCAIVVFGVQFYTFQLHYSINNVSKTIRFILVVSAKHREL